MAITQALCNTAKVALMSGGINLTTGSSQTFKLALYTSSATLNKTTSAYTSANEVSGTGYTAGGVDLVISQSPVLSGDIAIMDFADASWSNATFTSRGGLIYVSGGTAIAVVDFGGDISITAGNFLVQFPAFNATDAILRIS